MDNIGIRTEQLFGEGYRNAAEVMAHEVFILGNTDILDNLATTIFKGTKFQEELQTLSDVLLEIENNEELSDFCDRVYEDETLGVTYFERIIEGINNLTGKNIKYALWLCDSVEEIKNEYEIVSSDNFTIFDLYEKSDVILSDIGKGGKLYGYEELPSPFSHLDIEDIELEKD